MKRIISSVLLGVLLLTLVAVPVLAAYYAYLIVEEEDGNDYEELALTCTRNITQLVQYDLITSTGLDTRVLTGEGSPLPHMLAEDRIMFTSDLDAYETKTLIFYCGATSLDNFYIIPGYDGYITTVDDADLELTYVVELLISGYYDTATGADKNILYKEDAFRVYISDNDEITVAGLSAGDVEEWTLEYSSFTTGFHTVYVVADGLSAKLYVDTFEIPKDTINLYNGYVSQFDATYDGRFMPYARKTFYANGRYWAFYTIDYPHDTLFYRTSTDGQSWTAATEIVVHNITTNYFDGFSVWYCPDTDLFHITYGNILGYQVNSGLSYRAGTPNANGTISWETDWQKVNVANGSLRWAVIACDKDGYPYIRLRADTGPTSGDSRLTKSSRNDGVWATAAGYPKYNNEVAYASRGCLIGYPNSNKMYLLDFQTSYGVRGRYYNGVTWSGSWEYFDDTWTSCQLDSLNCIADMDDNVVAVWGDGPSGCGQINLRVRYADASFSNTVELTSTLGGYPTISYDIERDLFYIYWVYDNVSVYVQVFDLDRATISAPYFLGTPTALWNISAAPYNNIGVLCIGSASTTTYTMCDLYWTWNDNSNNWTWMENNVMPYGDYFTMAVDGVTQLEYEPSDIIEGTTLPDEESHHDGIITWGENPLGVTTSLSVFADEDEAGPPLEGTIPGLTPPPDMVGPTGQPGWTADIPSLVTHPLYPLVNVVSGVTGIPSKLIWILGATLLVAAAMLVCFRYAPHQLITVFVGGGLSAFFYSMDIYPFWVIFIFAVMGIAVIIGERSPTVS